jgi:hypothetical protein
MSCAVCGHGIGKLATQIRLPDGRVVCGYCRDKGALARRLGCGHVGMPGMTVFRAGSDVHICKACAADSMKAAKG